ncbi:MAG: methyltransferase domain-containing protein [Rhizobiales bacterium]|nr:methyltransferase domain-containing protein [Hyphomicrobiales bacterium]
MTTSLSQKQFGANAQGYLTSKPHAQGRSLDRMVALANPQADWVGLDIATGAGHTAYAFAPHVRRMWATDITPEMLDIVRGEVAKRGRSSMRVATARAEGLPFEDATFDLVTCRIAPHHFDSIPQFLAEVHRVLKPGGTLAVVDNVVPEGSVGDYVNAFERFRDLSHLRAWTAVEWRDALATAGFSITHAEELPKTMEFEPWAARHDETMQRLLRGMLREATPAVKAFLNPVETDGRWTFDLLEALFIARKPAAA